MILVAGLAIAGLAGIAAAFYFSVRPGRSRDATGADRFPRSRGRNSRPSSSRTARSSGPARSASSTNRRAAGHSRPEPAAGLREDPGSLVADRRTIREASTGPMRRASTGPMPAARPLPEARAGRPADAQRLADAGRRAGLTRHADAARSAEEDTQAAAEPSRSRRRVGWRKGADVDEEMWPTEAFGGVSDEQFWDDLASDKPLATTARTADPGPRRADSRPRRQSAEAYSRQGPGAGDQTMVQPAAVPTAQPLQAAAVPPPVATQPYPTVTQSSPTATQPVRAARQPAEPRGRRSANVGGFGADEDPLTSPAYSLRAKGAVDGRSNQPSHRSREPYQTAPLRGDPPGSGGYRTDPLRPGGSRAGSPASPGTNGTPAHQPAPGSGSGYGGTAGYPYPEQPYSPPVPSTPSANTPPYGDIYGYRNPAGQAADPRQANGSRGHGRHGGNGADDGSWGSRPAYPPVNGNGYRSPYDPRGNDRRLTTLR